MKLIHSQQHTRMEAQQSGERQIAHNLAQFLREPQHYVELRCALGCVYEIAHRELCTCAVSSFSHTCAYSIYMGAEGVQRIAAALVHNSTLHTLT
jgi:hypothetical protein